ncbi:MAG: acyltransferase [Hyphomicrobiales bacterium]
MDGTTGRERLENVDGLRAIAIAAVLLFHYTTRFPAHYYRADSMPLSFPIGAYGVDLFFAISGFCIFMTLERTPTVAEFLAKRVARLQPAYMAAVVMTFVAVAIAGLPGREIGMLHALGNLVWLEAIPGWPPVDGAYWSLVVELKFYALFAVLYVVARGLSMSLAWALFCAVAMVMALAAEDLPAGVHAGFVSQELLIAPFAPLFLVGIIAWESRSGWSRALTAASVVAAVLLTISPRFADLPWLGLAIGILAFGGLRMTRLRIPRAVTLLGLVSYPLYLIHQNIGLIVMRELAPVVPPVSVRIVLATAVVTGLAVALHRSVELRWQKPLAALLLAPLRTIAVPAEGFARTSR